ncbi:MAG: polyprenyl synthetase family protein [Deltaproteobacteria bacterium]|nr:polyprenyl synthetase family protein [Deltaproteobacteria bacterium]
MKIISRELERFEKFLFSSTKTTVPFIGNVSRYVMEAGGKRIRPALVILSSKICGYSGKRAIAYAAVIELIHTATLLHDDVLDNAKLRRGRPSVNHLWGNEPCVLIGDFFYSKAVEIMGKDGDKELIRIVSRATTEVAKGEILEILKTGDLTVDEREYFEIIGSKTAALFSAACEIGAVLANKERKTREALKKFGENIGLAFQLTDDALDYISTDRSLGKKVGTDLKEKKVTLPLIKALKAASLQEKRMVEEIFEKKRVTSQDFYKVKDFIERKGGFKYTYEVAKRFIEEGKDLLVSISPSPHKNTLLKLSDDILTRKS